ncbi:hypothetical protein LBMAG53_07100 [Planctomycetota bacterium]|nr:hypothetical protein LBMAG53_07100 [Planctomycetota bacterium]
MDRLAQRWECTTTGVSPLRPQEVGDESFGLATQSRCRTAGYGDGIHILRMRQQVEDAWQSLRVDAVFAQTK